MTSAQPTISNVEASATTTKSGSAWIASRTSERVLAQQTFASDPKYKKYTQQVEKCLNSFDNVHEWADFIAFLKVLLKTFQSYMQFKEIPRKLVVAKRLAQCLNPALPTGVHQRALDVYAHILAVLGSEGLRRDLALWSSGLFPFFEYAATSVKPTLLNLYDTHYLPLGDGLRPIMKSFIIALLPGLEEETGEFFDKVLGLLDKLAHTVSLAFFFQNIWLVMLTTPSARGTALNLLSRRLPQLSADEDITTIVGRDIGLMVRAFSAALEDENLLVRRGALDLLLQSMRVDSDAIRKAHPDDRTILMRAATSVVLRRDLSLNRRLYTWLLGPEEKSDVQIAYLNTNALALLTATLKNEMDSPSGEYSQSRPFKIFISLLDKWEIGSAVTESLVYHAFQAVKRLIELPVDGVEEITMTASTLYEAVEPHVLWKQLFSAVVKELNGDGTQFEAIRMVDFILRTFSQEEEIQTIHLPVFFSGIVDLLESQVRDDPVKASSVVTRECLLLQGEMLRHIPQSALMQRPELNAEVQTKAESLRAFAFACTFYRINLSTDIQHPLDEASIIPFASVFQNLASLTAICTIRLSSDQGCALEVREALSQALLLLDQLVGRLGGSVSLSWDPSKWLGTILSNMELESTTFALCDRIISLVIALYQTTGIQPRLSIEDRTVMCKMVNQLLNYLHPNRAAYHVRSVTLLWALQSATKHRHVESIIAQRMTDESKSVIEAYEAFGVLWRLTEDNLLPGFCFKVPLMIILSSLQSLDPSLRRVSETWMRCSLKSYLRILDPVLLELLDPAIRRTPNITKVHGKELQTFSYERPFDQRYTCHLLELLLSVVRFGGQGFAKTARTTPIRRSFHTGLVTRVETSGLFEADSSYLDILIEILLRFLQSEPNSVLKSTMHVQNAAIQSTAIDLLQTIVARGEIDLAAVEGIEAVVVAKLYYCIHLSRLDLQNKLLHLLHSLISASTSPTDSSAHPPSRLRQDDINAESVVSQDDPLEPGVRTYPANSLLVHTLLDGISTRTNRPVLQHWLDFILMAVPQFQPALQAVITPLNDCICRQLFTSLNEVLHVSSLPKAEDAPLAVNDADFLMLLNGLERLVLLNLAYTLDPASPEEETIPIEKSTSETSGLLGYVSGVFSSETLQQAPEEQLTSRSSGYRSLHEAVRVLYSIWGSLAWNAPKSASPRDESLSVIYNRTRLRCRRVFEHLFRMQSAEVFESIVDCWNRESFSFASQNVGLDLMDTLTSSAQNAVHMVCESISCRILGTSEKAKRQAINPNLNEVALFKFLEQYLRRLEGPLALQVWARFVQLAKEIITSTKDFKPQIYFALRCTTALAEKITQTTAIEDKRTRKELQDVYGKLLDSCVFFVGRSFESGSWIRRGVREGLSASGTESPLPRAELKLDEKMDASTSSLVDLAKTGNSSDLIIQINTFISSLVLPNLRRFLVDNDKIATASSNIVYYIVGPAIKGKTRPLDIDSSINTMLREMAAIPAALKSWKPIVTELLADTRLFNSTAESAEQWKPIVRALYDLDKSALTELLSRVATAPSANIFTNREYEMLLRSLNIRRLSFVLFTGDKNHFLTQLPSIQEKLVDVLRNVPAPIVQSEVFLCIRVLLCRLSPHNMTSFWPVVLTELYRIFEQVMINVPADGSEELQLILAACKCLDLLVTLQTEEFQIHQWTFITDTIDAVYRPDGWYPEAMIDQLAEIIGNLPSGDKSVDDGNTDNQMSSSFASEPGIRRPLLSSLRQIESIRDLVPFFSHASILSYESVYASGGNIDWDAVEGGIMEDMFDGH